MRRQKSSRAANRNERVLIVGAGGHALVVADILQQSQGVQAVGYVDDNPAIQGQRLLGLPVHGPIAELPRISHDAIIIAIGDNAIRRRLFTHWTKLGERFLVAQHPSSVVARDVIPGPGTVIAAGVIINPGSTLGANVILNTGCSIDHHSRIGAHTHVAPGVHTGGDVEIEEGVLLGIGATVLPRCRVGANSIVAAGAVVCDDVPAGVVVMGIPARIAATE